MVLLPRDWVPHNVRFPSSHWPTLTQTQIHVPIPTTMDSVVICRTIHTAQKPIQTQIIIEPSVVCIGVCVGVGVWQCERTIRVFLHFLPKIAFQVSEHAVPLVLSRITIATTSSVITLTCLTTVQTQLMFPIRK